MKHGMHKTTFYKRWTYVIKRCHNKNSADYKYYGGQGIFVCSEWRESFINFKTDMYESYLEHVEQFGERNTTIDRINNQLGYERDNCRWATQNEQNANKKSNRPFTAISPTGEIYNHNVIRHFAKEHCLDFSKISNCLHGKQKSHKGWTFKYLEAAKMNPIFLLGRSIQVHLKEGAAFYFKVTLVGPNYICGFDDEGMQLTISMDDIDFIK